jgi:hypothetical protein
VAAVMVIEGKGIWSIWVAPALESVVTDIYKEARPSEESGLVVLAVVERIDNRRVVDYWRETPSRDCRSHERVISRIPRPPTTRSVRRENSNAIGRPMYYIREAVTKP